MPIAIRISAVFTFTALLVIAGCSRSPGRVPIPRVNPERAADEALRLYDTDGDGSLSREELAQSPALLAKLDLYDTNGNGAIEREELVKRIAELYGQPVGLTRLQCQVTFRGRPLRGAVVRFEPEPYLGSEIKAAEGITNERGLAAMSIAPQELPKGWQNVRALQYGTFKVRITHPQIDLPARYNTHTQLGYETEPGNPYVRFALTDR